MKSIPELRDQAEQLQRDALEAFRLHCGSDQDLQRLQNALYHLTRAHDELAGAGVVDERQLPFVLPPPEAR